MMEFSGFVEISDEERDEIVKIARQTGMDPAVALHRYQGVGRRPKDLNTCNDKG